MCSTNDEDSAFTNEDSDDSNPVDREQVPDSMSDLHGEHERNDLCLVRHGDDSFAVTGDSLCGDHHRFQFVTTSGDLLSTSAVPVATNQGQIKTTHIVIHNQTLSSSGISDESPQTPLPPPTPATPWGREHGFRYQWDSSAFESIIPVRCKNSNGELYKSKFGSGWFYLS